MTAMLCPSDVVDNYIGYTLDGTHPSARSTRYTKPLVFADTTPATSVMRERRSKSTSCCYCNNLPLFLELAEATECQHGHHVHAKTATI